MSVPCFAFLFKDGQDSFVPVAEIPHGTPHRGRECALLIPNLSEPVGIFRVLIQGGGQSHEMAATRHGAIHTSREHALLILHQICYLVASSRIVV